MQGEVEILVKKWHVVPLELIPTVVATEPSAPASLQRTLYLYRNLVGNIWTRNKRRIKRGNLYIPTRTHTHTRRFNRMFIGPCIIEELKTNFMSLVVFISLIFAQHVSNNNISIFRSLRLWWWLTTSVILFSFRCVLGVAAGDAWWYPFCSLKHYCSVCVVCGDIKWHQVGF